MDVCLFECCASGWSLMHRSPIECDVCVCACVIVKPRYWGGSSPLGLWSHGVGGSYPSSSKVMSFIICILSHKLLGLYQRRPNSPILWDFAVEVCKHFLFFTFLILLNLILILMLNEDYILWSFLLIWIYCCMLLGLFYVNTYAGGKILCSTGNK